MGLWLASFVSGIPVLAARNRLGANQPREAALCCFHRQKGGGFGAGAAQGT